MWVRKSMVSVIQRTKGNSQFYYLKHATSTRQKEKYLGKIIPKDIESLKQVFLLEFYSEEWLPKLIIIKKSHIKEYRRMNKNVKENNLQAFLMEFVYNSQRMIDSSLTFIETVELVRDKITPTRKSQFEMFETQNCFQLSNTIFKRKKKLTFPLLKMWHKKMYKKTQNEYSGVLRDYMLKTIGSKQKPLHYKKIEKAMNDYFDWYSQKKDLHPVLFAGLAYQKFTTISPFGYGNEVIARLVMNVILNNNNYPMLDIDIRDKSVCLKANEKAQMTKNEVYFLQWFVKYYIKKISKDYDIE
ncbi:MAG: Fic family protein [Candidatus Nitrosoabyssus spongiisocia]|nr:MAG: Fic family protein [Nitrosopumilaceae archaeon AB1(1)]